MGYVYMQRHGPNTHCVTTWRGLLKLHLLGCMSVIGRWLWFFGETGEIVTVGNLIPLRPRESGVSLGRVA
ncbi:hypothetical protein EYF80_034246 [Liparis tanakae]|uniref:Uncharacterized protein n=1 Tax=Liparis tanakae TaxID=230148 RepID=A0A4Z2GS51_9TELE|nr:hypothetical protein EYF80_034246 [Liparis tanakae]